jgi:hypothetical protein
MEKLKIVGVFFLLAVVFRTASNPVFAENPIRITMEENALSVHTDSRSIMRYHYENVPFKPCVHELFTPGGVNILRDAPADHLHHHALMYAIAVDGINFWEEQQAPGRQAHRSFANVRIDKQSKFPGASFSERLDWINPRSQELKLKESRTISVLTPESLKATVLCWQSSFSVPPGKESVTLSGSHYFGLGMRFVKSMDTGGEFFNAAGKQGEIVRGDERIVRADWCAYTAKANGKVVTVAMFGHPDNMRHPTHWFTMGKPFAYLSATLNLYREPMKILADKPLALSYAVAVWDNRIDREQVQKVYDWWVGQQF